MRDVLAALYDMEKFEQLAVPTYYAIRDLSPRGQVVGGLIYARGLATHKDASVRLLAWRPIKQDYVGVGGEWRPIKQHYVGVGGEWRPVTGSAVGVAEWPPLATLPRPDGPERHGRDLMYGACVAGRSLLEPLQEARAFFAAELP